MREFRASDGAAVRGVAASALGGWDGRRGWLEERRRDRGCRKVNLIVWEDKAAAMDFWAAEGYGRARTVEFEKEL